MTNNFFKLLWLPILINASDYYTPEAARARAEESIRRFGARYDVYTDKAISQQAPFNKPMQSAQQNRDSQFILIRRAYRSMPTPISVVLRT